VYSKKKFLAGCSLTTFSSTEEAIAIANDTPYGLGAVFGLVMLTNYSKFHVLFKRVEFG
jgi:acyl-CoA reductase-like NAD-dependent aldehyde dehydrogenase